MVEGSLMTLRPPPRVGVLADGFHDRYNIGIYHTMVNQSACTFKSLFTLPFFVCHVHSLHHTPTKMHTPTVPNPNHVNPPMRPPGVEDTSIVLIVLGVLILALRMYTKYRILRNFGLDDLFAFLGMVCTISYVDNTRVYAREVITMLESHAD